MTSYCYNVKIFFLFKILFLKVFLKLFISLAYYCITASLNGSFNTYSTFIIGYTSYSNLVVTLLRFYLNLFYYLYSRFLR